ncbi:MAG TPA: cyclic nucleotide-binding domain-containing protein [Polyangiaceae bacterium]|nr:cyclic nucleotide-binding domain-containing protein [Polyangiaceae bacterium]
MPKAPPELPGGPTAESPVDRALALALASENDTALRWAAAIVLADPAMASGLLLTGRLLADLGRVEGAREALEVCVARSIDAGQLPLAVAACSDLRTLGCDFSKHFDAIADAFAAGSPRLGEGGATPPKLPHADDFHPLASVLTGPALLGKATEIIHVARRALESEIASRGEAPLIAPQPLFSSIGRDGLRAMIEVFEVSTVPQGAVVIEEGTGGAEAYIVARGELEVKRTVEGKGTLVLARLTGGALFGEMALLSRAPRAASVVACRPSIVLVGRKDALDSVAEREPEVATELASHCRRRMVQNLVRTSPILSAVHADERPALVERFETRIYEKGDKLISEGSQPTGLHLIASGEVAVLRTEAGEAFVLATLGPGDMVGEVAMVLRRAASADVVAVHPTVTLHLAIDKFMSMIREHPMILTELYELAIKRDDETSSIVAEEATSADDYVLI